MWTSPGRGPHLLLLVAIAGRPALARAGAPDGGAPRPAPPGHRIELFPEHLETVAGAGAGGQRAGAGDGASAPVQRSVREAAGAARVRAGEVSPGWRALERRVKAAFHPSIASVSTGSAPRALAAQAVQNEPGGPPRTRKEPTPDGRGEIDPDELIDASHRATRRARDLRVAEVEVRLAADGTLATRRLVRGSGSALLDEAALDAVTRAFEGAPVADHEDFRVARLRLTGARAVTPLDLAPVTTPDSKYRVRGVMPKVRFQFDEVKGTMKAEKPFSQQVETEVTLLSLMPAE